MLERLTIPLIHTAIDIGKVALIFQGQLPPPKGAGTIAGSARARAETRALALPKSVEIICQLLHRLAGHTPAIRVEQI